MARERHPSIHPTSVWTTTPSTAQPSTSSPPAEASSIPTHSGQTLEPSWVPSCLLPRAPRPFHPPAKPVRSTFKLYPESNCILQLPGLLTSWPRACGAPGKGMHWHSRALGPGSRLPSLGLSCFICRKGEIKCVICLLLSVCPDFGARHFMLRS